MPPPRDPKPSWISPLASKAFLKMLRPLKVWLALRSATLVESRASLKVPEAMFSARSPVKPAPAPVNVLEALFKLSGWV